MHLGIFLNEAGGAKSDFGQEIRAQQAADGSPGSPMSAASRKSVRVRKIYFRIDTEQRRYAARCESAFSWSTAELASISFRFEVNIHVGMTFDIVPHGRE